MTDEREPETRLPLIQRLGFGLLMLALALLVLWFFSTYRVS